MPITAAGLTRVSVWSTLTASSSNSVIPSGKGWFGLSRPGKREGERWKASTRRRMRRSTTSSWVGCACAAGAIGREYAPPSSEGLILSVLPPGITRNRSRSSISVCAGVLLSAVSEASGLVLVTVLPITSESDTFVDSALSLNLKLTAMSFSAFSDNSSMRCACVVESFALDCALSAFCVPGPGDCSASAVVNRRSSSSS